MDVTRPFVLLSVLLMLVVCAQTGRAFDYETERLSERADSPLGESVTGRLVEVGWVASTPSGPRSESLYQGKPAIWWARRAVQARKDANARGRTIRRLKRQLRGGVLPWYWLAVGSCESGLRWGYNGSSGFDGALQFHPTTWRDNKPRGYPTRAYLASPFQQLVVAEIVLSRQGWRAWPHCSRKVGLR